LKPEANFNGGDPLNAESYSAPIKTQIIGTPDDAQLKAAIGYFSKTQGRG